MQLDPIFWRLISVPRTCPLQRTGSCLSTGTHEWMMVGKPVSVGACLRFWFVGNRDIEFAYDLVWTYLNWGGGRKGGEGGGMEVLMRHTFLNHCREVVESGVRRLNGCGWSQVRPSGTWSLHRGRGRREGPVEEMFVERSRNYALNGMKKNWLKAYGLLQIGGHCNYFR